MPFTVRTATSEDTGASWALSAEAFSAGTPPATLPDPVHPSWTMYVLCDDDLDGRVVGKCRDRHYDAWFGGRPVSTAGIASVCVAGEHRGRGGLTPLFATMLAGARDRGAVVSTLFPTAPAIYRGLGYEVIGSCDHVEIPTHELRGIRPGRGSVRRATATDATSIRRIYDDWAAHFNGPLTRRGVSFTQTGQELIDAFTGVTIADDEHGTPVGYALWRRTGGYREPGRLHIDDLCALTADGYRNLLSCLSSHHTVAPTTVLRTSGSDTVRALLPTTSWQVVERESYMLLMLDVPAAVEALAEPGAVRTSAGFHLTGHPLDADHAYRLEAADGEVRCHRVDHAEADWPTLTAGGLAALASGATTYSSARLSAALTGPAGHDRALGQLFGTREVHIRDTF